jgi:hypothetical protein
MVFLNLIIKNLTIPKRVEEEEEKEEGEGIGEGD